MSHNIEDDIFITLKESLLTYSKETIKNVLWEVMKRYKVEIKAKANYELTLKVLGFKEYFRGNY